MFNPAASLAGNLIGSVVHTLPTETIIHARPVDYVIIAIYFVFVLGIGLLGRAQVSDSVDFFLSGRSMPAWVTGLAFISANLGAVEIMGNSANGAQYGLPAVHFFWIGAIPAMLFLGVVMMPFYYGSKVRSVPEFMLRRFGPAAHLVNAVSFAIAQLLIAGVNLFLLGSIIQALLGWPLLLALVVSAAIVLAYITLGGLKAAIYNEVLQFFVIMAGLLPLTLIGLHRVGGWGGLKAKVTTLADNNPELPSGHQQLHSWPGNALTGFSNDFLSIIGIVFGLGFVLSFGYWTTNFVEVQRALASDSISSARKTPIIGAFPKILIPFITILPGMIAAVSVAPIVATKLGKSINGGASGGGKVTYNDSLIYLMRDVLPSGLLGLAITGLLAAFMAGMAANISAFNTVVSYDIVETYVVKGRSDDFYLRVGRWATVAAAVIAIGTAGLASNFSNIFTYLQNLFGFFNAPLFATFILGMFWKRMTPTAAWIGLVMGTLSAVVVAFLSQDGFGSLSIGLLSLHGQGSSFVAAGAAFVVDVVLSVAISLVTAPKPVSELKGLVYSETPRSDLVDADEASYPWWRRTVPLAGVALAIVVVLNIAF